jgi:hypothetical protein
MSMTQLCDEFVTSLMAKRQGDNAWQYRHNSAVHHWADRTHIDPGTENGRNERVVLNHAYAIWTLLHSQWGTDGYVQPNVTEPMMQAFHDLLNIDLGRLDGGTLSSWLCRLAEQHNIEGVL